MLTGRQEGLYLMGVWGIRDVGEGGHIWCAAHASAMRSRKGQVGQKADNPAHFAVVTHPKAAPKPLDPPATLATV